MTRRQFVKKGAIWIPAAAVLVRPAYGAVAHIAAVAASGTNGATTGTIDTTGANFLAVVVTAYTGGPADNLTDETGACPGPCNTFVALTSYILAGGSFRTTIYYCANATVGTGHTFSNSGSGNYTSVAAAAFSGVATSSPFVTGTDHGDDTIDVDNHITPGSVTPTTGNLVISGAGCYFSGSTTNFNIESPFTIAAQSHSGGAAEGAAIGYYIAPDGSAVDPGWWTDDFRLVMAVIAEFSAAGGGAPPAIRRRPIG